MQGICLFMQLFGMHLCVYSIFLKAGSLYKFAIALAVASIWFTVLAAAPLRRLEHKVGPHTAEMHRIHRNYTVSDDARPHPSVSSYLL